MNSEEALNGIYDILQTTIDEYKQRQRQQASGTRETSGIFEELLSGVSAAAYSDVKLGDQINALADGMSMLKKNGVTADDAQTVATIVNTIGESISNLRIQSADVEALASVIQALTMLGSIDGTIINKIDSLKSLNVDVAKTINDFIHSLDLSALAAMSDENISQNIASLATFLSNIVRILDQSNVGFRSLFLPIKGYLLGKSIAVFFAQIIKAIPKDEIELKIFGITELFNPLLPLIATDSKYSIERMLFLMNAENGKQLGGFFRAFLDEIPKEEEVKSSVTAVKQLLELATGMTMTKFIKMRLVLTEKNGQRIGSFFKAIIDPLNNTTYPDLKSITDFLKALSEIGVLGVLTLTLLKPVLTPKFGENIGGFITSLTDPLDEDRMNRMKGYSDAMKTLSQGILYLTGSIALLTATISIFGFMTVLGATAVSVVYIGSILFLMKRLVKSGDEIKEGIRSLNDISKVMILMTGQIIALSVMSMLMGLVDWESIGKIAVMTVIVGGFMTWALAAGDKWQNGGKNAQDAMVGVSIMLVSAAAALAIVTWVAKENSIGDILLGMGMIAAVFVGTYFIIEKILKKSDKEYDNAVSNLWQIMAIMGVTALMLNFLVAPLAKKADSVIGGMVLVTVAVGAMAFIVGLLAKLPADQLNAATKAMAVMTAIVGAISLLSIFAFPVIWQNKGPIMGGAFIVSVIVAAMAFTVGLLAKVKEKDLDAAKNAILSMTLMFGVVSLLAATLLIPIGQNWDKVLGGFIVVGAIIGLLIGATYLLAMVEQKNLDAATNSLYAMTIMVTAVSLISLLLFIPIGQRWKEIMPGAILVMGIVAALAGIVWVLGKTKADSLRMATVAMVVMTAIVLAVSFIALELFIPLAHQWDSVLVGGVLVLGTIAIMGLIVWRISKIKKDNLLYGILGVTAMAIMLLGVSLIINELIIPIGYEAEAAAYGSAIVLGTIAMMGLIVAGLSLIPKEKLIAGALTVAGITAILWSLQYTMPPYIEMCKLMYENGEAAAIGGLEILATIGVWGLIFAGIGALMWGPQALVVAAGAATVESIAVILYSLGEMLPSYIRVCKMMEEDAARIAIGGAEIVETITAWGVIFGAMALLTLPVMLATPAIAITETALYGITKIFPPYIKAAKMANDNRDALINGSKLMGQVIEDMGWLMGKIGLIFGNPLGAVAITLGLAAVGEIAVAMRSLNWVIASFASITRNLDKNGLDLEKIKEVTNKFVADGGLVDAITNIVSRMSDVGVWASARAAVITASIRPIFSTISDFTKVISQILNMKYVTEWDEKGRPKSYMTVTPEMYAAAGITVSVAFSKFLIELGKGMRDLKGVSAGTLHAMGFAIRPVMKAVRDFTESIIKVLSAAIPDQFDENGKPISYRKFRKEEFGDAAVAISEAFGTFLTTLGPKLKEMGPYAAKLVEMLAKGIGPVIDAVAKFTDMITSILTGKTYETVKDGKKVTEFIRIKPEEFKDAGQKIADAFTNFIDVIYKAFTKDEYNTKHTFSSDEPGGKLGELINSLKNIGTVIESVNKFVGVIVDAVEKTKEIDLKAKGETIATAFTAFVDKMLIGLSGEEKQEQIKQLVSTMNQVNKIIKESNKAIDNILKIFNGREEAIRNLVTVDENGKTVIDTLFRAILEFVRSKEEIEKMKSMKISDIAILVPYLKKVNESAKQLMKLAEFQQNSADIMAGIDNYLLAVSKFYDFKAPDIHEMAPMPFYMKYVLKTAKRMRELADVMNDVAISQAIVKFLTDIQMLTQPKLMDRADVSRRALIMFGNDLMTFKVRVSRTQDQMVKFTHKMDKATESLRKFDDALINNERKRQESLEKFAKAIKDITDNLSNLHSQFDSLNENKLLGTFGNIMNLIKTVTSSRNVPEEPTATSAQKSPQTSSNNVAVVNQGVPGQNVGSTTNNFVANGGMPQQMLVTMVFSNTQFTGTMEIKNI